MYFRRDYNKRVRGSGCSECHWKGRFCRGPVAQDCALRFIDHESELAVGARAVCCQIADDGGQFVGPWTQSTLPRAREVRDASIVMALGQFGLPHGTNREREGACSHLSFSAPHDNHLSLWVEQWIRRTQARPRAKPITYLKWSFGLYGLNGGCGFRIGRIRLRRGIATGRSSQENNHGQQKGILYGSHG